MARMGTGKPPLVTVHRQGPAFWLCSLHFGRGVIQDHILTNGCTKYLAINRMRKHAKKLGIPLPKKIPVT